MFLAYLTVLLQWVMLNNLKFGIWCHGIEAKWSMMGHLDSSICAIEGPNPIPKNLSAKDDEIWLGWEGF